MKTFTILLILHLIVQALTETVLPTVDDLLHNKSNMSVFDMLPNEFRESLTKSDMENLSKALDSILNNNGILPIIPLISKFSKKIENESTEPNTSTGSLTESVSNIVSNNSSFRIENDCIQSKTISSKIGKICQGQLIFEETFQENQLDSKIWSKEIRIPSDYDDGDFISYQDLSENCYIKNNQLYLYIVPTLLENTNDFNVDRVRNGVLDFDKRECSRRAGLQRILPPIVSARISTREKFSFQYGRIEIKAKLPKGDWLFPQLLLEPYSTHAYGDKGYASGQIRIAFNRGNNILTNEYDASIGGFRLYGGVVVTAGEKLREKFLTNRVYSQHLSDDFHIYLMIWTNESMRFEVDGTDYGILNDGFGNHPNLINLKEAEKWRNGEFMAPFDSEFFISLGVSAGGISNQYLLPNRQ